MVSSRGQGMYEMSFLAIIWVLRQERNMQWFDRTSSSTELLKEKIRFFGDLMGFNRFFVL